MVKNNSAIWPFPMFFTFLKDLLFPKLCVGCSAIGSYICSVCQDELSPIEYDACIYCEKKSYMGLTHPGCKRKYGIDGAVAFYHYDDFMKKIIKHIKYRLATDVFKDFCSIVQPEMQKKLIFYKQICRNGLLQHVPLHSTKLKSRGFNQALLIAKFFNTILRFPIVDFLERAKATKPQAELKDRKARYVNIKGSFKPKKNAGFFGKSIIVVDDVVTSGNTVMELSRVIKQQGAEKVYVVVLAKG